MQAASVGKGYLTFKQMREGHTLTQRQVAEFAGITTQTVSNMERGGYSPALTATQFAKLCELFGVSIMELAIVLEPEQG